MNKSDVVLGLESAEYYFHRMTVVCPKEHKHYYETKEQAIKEAIALLKEQEPKQVGLYGKEDWYGLVCVCPDCKAVWMSGESETHFCPNCRRPLKWERATERIPLNK